MLEKGHELALIKEAQQGSDAAKSTLYACYEKFIRSFSKKYKSNTSTISEEDLFAYAVVGFIDSIYHFDLSSDARLSTYSTFRMRSEIFAYLNTNLKGYKVFTTKPMKKVFANLGKYRKDTDRLTEEQAQLMSKELNIPLADIYDVERRLSQVPVSFESENENDYSLQESIMANDAIFEDPEYLISEVEEKVMISEKLKSSIEQLPSRSKEIVRKRMLPSGKPLTLELLGNELNVSCERIRQIEKEIICTLRKNILPNS
jgi:RNA polymerase sigma-32 factor